MLKRETLQNPKTGSVTDARVCNLPDGGYLAIDIGFLHRNPRVFDQIDKRYSFAIKFWKAIGSIIVLAGIALSFAVAWWIFIPAILICGFIGKHNITSTGDFAIEAIQNIPDAFQILDRYNCTWSIVAK